MNYGQAASIARRLARLEVDKFQGKILRLTYADGTVKDVSFGEFHEISRHISQNRLFKIEPINPNKEDEAFLAWVYDMIFTDDDARYLGEDGNYHNPY